MNSENTNIRGIPATNGDPVAQVCLRDIERNDLPSLYEFQLDPEANQLAATNPRSAEVFDAHWEKILQDQSVIVKAILVGDLLAGCISCFKADGLDVVGYWLGREFWGNGVATRALQLLLVQISIRPLYARVAVSNVGSLRVVQKCGFSVVRHEHSPGDDRYVACEEAILILV